jgi:hypothetical protein
MNRLNNPELEQLRVQYLKIIDDAKILSGDLSNEQINQRPQPGKWSIAECIDHLTITNNTYYHVAKPAIEDAILNGKFGEVKIKLGIIGKIFMKFEPPPKLRMKTPKLFNPSPKKQKIFDKEILLKDFIESKMKMIELMERADGLNLNKIKMHSPVSKLFRVKLGDYFTIMAPHDRRHLWQAAQVKTMF